VKISRISKRFSIALILIVDSFVVVVSGSANTPNAVKLSHSLMSAVEVNGAGFGSAQPAVLVLLIPKLNVIGLPPRISYSIHFNSIPLN